MKMQDMKKTRKIKKNSFLLVICEQKRFSKSTLQLNSMKREHMHFWSIKSVEKKSYTLFIQSP